MPSLIFFFAVVTCFTAMTTVFAPDTFIPKALQTSPKIVTISCRSLSERASRSTSSAYSSEKMVTIEPFLFCTITRSSFVSFRSRIVTPSFLCWNLRLHAVVMKLK